MPTPYEEAVKSIIDAKEVVRQHELGIVTAARDALNDSVIKMREQLDLMVDGSDTKKTVESYIVNVESYKAALDSTVNDLSPSKE